LERNKNIRLLQKKRGMNFWLTGYFVSIVGLNEVQIVRYVCWQQKKDIIKKICSGVLM